MLSRSTGGVALDKGSETADAGAPQEPHTHPPGREPYARHRKPALLTAALTFVTFGAYGPFWLASNWQEVQTELDGRRTSTVGHGIAMLVPVYGLFRLDAHVRAINELLARADVRTPVSRLLVSGAAIFGWLLLPTTDVFLTNALTDAGANPVATIQITFFTAVGLFALAAGTCQAGFNRFIDGTPDRPTSAKIHWAERLGLIVLVPFVAWAVVFWFVVFWIAQVLR